jgi:hypothetical protein
VFPNRGDNTDDVFLVTLPTPPDVVHTSQTIQASLVVSLTRITLHWDAISDAATLAKVKGSVIAEPQKPSVALLLQMTVSGATGLPRRPKHRSHNTFERISNRPLRQTCQTTKPTPRSQYLWYHLNTLSPSSFNRKLLTEFHALSFAVCWEPPQRNATYCTKESRL